MVADVSDERLREVAVKAAKIAGQILKDRLGLVHKVHHKGEIDLVTEVDLECEAVIVASIRSSYPTHQVLAEEGTVGGQDATYRWIIDPLDGTTNFAHGLPFFCVSIALEVHGRVVAGVVYDPMREELFEAELGRGAWLNGEPVHVSAANSLAASLLATGFPYDRAAFPTAMRQFEALSMRSLAVRRLGSAALDLCYVANGRFDAYWESTINPWDVAAGSLIVQEAGGVLSDLRGNPFDPFAGQVLSSTPGIHDEIIEALGPIVD